METSFLPQAETISAPTRATDKLAFSKKELCDAIGVSPVTLWRLEKRGLLRPVAGIRHRIYSRKEVERFLSSGGRAA
jgi:hypothetical protein